MALGMGRGFAQGVQSGLGNYQQAKASGRADRQLEMKEEIHKQTVRSNEAKITKEEAVATAWEHDKNRLDELESQSQKLENDKNKKAGQAIFYDHLKKPSQESGHTAIKRLENRPELMPKFGIAIGEVRTVGNDDKQFVAKYLSSSGVEPSEANIQKAIDSNLLFNFKGMVIDSSALGMAVGAFNDAPQSELDNYEKYRDGVVNSFKSDPVPTPVEDSKRYPVPSMEDMTKVKGTTGTRSYTYPDGTKYVEKMGEDGQITSSYDKSGTNLKSEPDNNVGTEEGGGKVAEQQAQTDPNNLGTSDVPGFEVQDSLANDPVTGPDDVVKRMTVDDTSLVAPYSEKEQAMDTALSNAYGSAADQLAEKMSGIYKSPAKSAKTSFMSPEQKLTKDLVDGKYEVTDKDGKTTTDLEAWKKDIRELKNVKKDKDTLHQEFEKSSMYRAAVEKNGGVELAGENYRHTLRQYKADKGVGADGDDMTASIFDFGEEIGYKKDNFRVTDKMRKRASRLESSDSRKDVKKSLQEVRGMKSAYEEGVRLNKTLRNPKLMIDFWEKAESKMESLYTQEGWEKMSGTDKMDAILKVTADTQAGQMLAKYMHAISGTAV